MGILRISIILSHWNQWDAKELSFDQIMLELPHPHGKFKHSHNMDLKTELDKFVKGRFSGGGGRGEATAVEGSCLHDLLVGFSGASVLPLLAWMNSQSDLAGLGCQHSRFNWSVQDSASISRWQLKWSWRFSKCLSTYLPRHPPLSESLLWQRLPNLLHHHHHFILFQTYH